MSDPMPQRDPHTGEMIVPMRLQKFLARSGVASRRGSEDLMTAGRVRVNGEVITELGSKVNPTKDEVRVDNKLVSLADQHVYIMLNKPAGYITTMSDPQGRPDISIFVPSDEYPGLFPVGRLDKDTTGILLFMTDGILARDLLHPGMHVDKTYQASCSGIFTKAQLKQLEEGVELEDGLASPAQAKSIDEKSLEHPKQAQVALDALKKAKDKRISHIELTIHEGKKRQVKRMCKALGHPVLALHRSSFGPLKLGTLKEGSYRTLSQKEVEDLKFAAYGNESPFEKRERLKRERSQNL